MKAIIYIIPAFFCFIMIPTFVFGQSSTWVAPKSADTLKNPYKVDDAFIKLGNNVFQKNCTTCHGKSGKGNGPAAIALNPRPANLTSDNVRSETEGAVYWKIVNGKGSMISWNKTLSAKEIWALVAYIKTDLAGQHK